MLTENKTSPFIMPRMCTLMFLLYVAYGAVLPIMSMYMNSVLHFSGKQTGFINAAMSISAFVTPTIGALIVDRFISAERLFVICQAIAAIAMYFIRYATDFHDVLFLYILYYAAFGPTLGLSNAIAFHHLPDSKSKFGFIRVWGTIAWIVVGVAFSYLWLRDGSGHYRPERLPDCFTLASLTSAFLAIYVLTMPRRPLHTGSGQRGISLSALRVFWNKRMLLVAIGFFIISAVGKYYYVGASIYLKAIDVQEEHIMPLMAIGQIPEVIGLLILSGMIKKFGCKTVLFLGLLTELWRCGGLMLGGNLWLVSSAVFCHGFSYSLFVTTTFVFMENYTTSETRSSAHQLFSMLNAGFASLLGSIMAGQCLDWFNFDGIINFRYFWAVPFCMTLVYFTIMLIFFKPTEKENYAR
ncbi:MAG: MFS transporter [Sedimentisphaerales bacterium]|nr:MFS transporter [Sedimentisphaerales bacterium]MBN2842043.1 MFS transporter [Sedimentisphaerales bacterium]